jgi:glycosyltransferase involved in cell wall biosynthesis
MLNALKEEAPDRIVVKGVDYALAREIFRMFPAERLSVIVGGVSSHALLERCGSVYFETRKQLESFKGSARTTILPKLIAWEQVKQHGISGIDYDVINIGNFEEPRKAQELLLPFALKHRVLFLGAGKRLEAFKQICEPHKNITFGGYVRGEQLFDSLSRSRLMIHSSVWDGYPRVVAESLAAGVPVLGLAGVLDGIAAEPIISCAPIEKLHEMGFSLLSDFARLDSMGAAAAAYMKQASSHEVLLERFNQIIK